MTALGVFYPADDVPFCFNVYLLGTYHRAGLERSLVDTVLRSIANESYVVHSRLLILCEAVLLSQRHLGLLILMGEEVFPARAPINVPTPETAFSRFRILVVGCAELAVLAGVSGVFHVILFLNI